jgi:hypothetical protein
MKRHKSLFEDVCSFSNLLAAADRAQMAKRMRPPVARFNQNIETELLRLRHELVDRTYRPGGFKTFMITDPKPRNISAAPYRDRVVHHALCNVVEPIFDRTFIYDSYASRKGKGVHAGVDRLTHFMMSSDYVLKCDINNNEDNFRCAYRDRNQPENRNNNLGFRCVLRPATSANWPPEFRSRKWTGACERSPFESGSGPRVNRGRI